MLAGHVPEDRTAGGPSDPTQAQGIPLTHDDHVTRQNSSPTDFIITQPLPATASSLEPAEFNNTRGDLCEPCPRCGRSPAPTVLDHRLPPLSPAFSRLQGSSLTVQSSSRKRSSLASSHQPAATHTACAGLVLACLSCQGSALLLGLLEACSSCLRGLCSSCCVRGCDRCCAALQEAPVEEFNCHAHCHAHCHAVLFEPDECLEFCLELCEICHHS